MWLIEADNTFSSQWHVTWRMSIMVRYFKIRPWVKLFFYSVSFFALEYRNGSTSSSILSINCWIYLLPFIAMTFPTMDGCKLELLKSWPISVKLSPTPATIDFGEVIIWFLSLHGMLGYNVLYRDYVLWYKKWRSFWYTAYSNHYSYRTTRTKWI